MKFEKKMVNTLMGEREMQMKQVPDPTDQALPHPPFQITASRQGIVLSGSTPPIGSMQELQDLAAAISSAWEEHRKIMPEITVTKVVI